MGKNNDYVSLDALAAVRDDKVVYLFGSSLNILYQYNITNDETEILSSIPTNSFFASELVGKMLKWENEIILIPFLGKSVWMYNLETNAWSCIELNNVSGATPISVQAFLYKDVLHIIGCNYPYFIRIELINQEVTYDNQPYKEIVDRGAKISGPFFRSEYIKNKNVITMGCLQNNLLMNYDLETSKFWLEKTDADVNSIEGIAVSNGLKVLVPRVVGEVFVYENNRWKQIDVNTDRSFLYTATVASENETWFLGWRVGKISYIYTNQGELLKDNKTYYFCDVTDDEYIAMDCKRNLILNGEINKNIDDRKCYVRKEDLLERCLNHANVDTMINESEYIDLNTFVDRVKLQSS